MLAKDQNGVVWWDGDSGTGFMAAESYKKMAAKSEDLPPYDDLPLSDSHQQDMVDVD